MGQDIKAEDFMHLCGDFLLRCTLFCHSVATFLTSVSSYEGGCGFEVYNTFLAIVGIRRAIANMCFIIYLNFEAETHKTTLNYYNLNQTA